MLELAPSGVEEVDGDGFVEYAVYGAPGELPEFPEGDASVGGVQVTVRGEPVAEDWAERWKAFHEPVLIEAPHAAAGAAAGDRPPAIWIRPPWAKPRADVIDLVIDPGQAFGTGAHPTTRLALELLLSLVPELVLGLALEGGGPAAPRGSFADLGCGSGVLAIAAAKLGFAPVIAVDNELAALDATRANATVNGVRLDRVERVNLREESPPEADTVVANLTRPLLLAVAKLMAKPAGRQPRALVLSGLLDEEADEVVAAFRGGREGGLAERRRLSAQGWTAVLLQ